MFEVQSAIAVSSPHLHEIVSLNVENIKLECSEIETDFLLGLTNHGFWQNKNKTPKLRCVTLCGNSVCCALSAQIEEVSLQGNFRIGNQQGGCSLLKTPDTYGHESTERTQLRRATLLPDRPLNPEFLNFLPQVPSSMWPSGTALPTFAKLI